MDSGIMLNWMLGLLNKKIVVPTEFHDQCRVVRQMLADDMSGIVDVLTDFAVQSATVDFAIETSNDTLNDILATWFKEINAEYATLPIGIKNLAQEYFKERWKGSSFPALKIAKWDAFAKDLILPTKMIFVDGSSIYAEDKNDSETVSIEGYNYYIGSAIDNRYKINSDNYIIQRPFCRWFDKYPVPYLVKRGVYHNWKIIEALKNKQSEILDQIIPYLLMIKKGSDQLAAGGKTYSQTELEAIVAQMQTLMDDITSTDISQHTVKTPIRASNFDEDFKHLIPDISTMFASGLFEQAERNILSGLGFIDVIQGVSSTRKESVLNPKAFIQEINAGIDGFKEILHRLLFMIKAKNDSHNKYINSDFYISSAPVKAFATPEFELAIRSLYDRGGISKQTYTEIISGLDFPTEVYRREREATDGTDETMYPQVVQNIEEKGIDIPGKETVIQKEVTPDKKGPEAKNFKNASTDEVIEETPEQKENKILDAKIKSQKLEVAIKQAEFLDKLIKIRGTN
jgi:hypothetical protein